ncbi:MAG: hypothetical protein ABID64_02230 [Nitrospirota bacterium]
MEENKPNKGPIIFYCKDCEEIVETYQVGRKYVYKCKKCGTKNVAFGTEKSLNTFFRLEEKEKQMERKKEKKEEGKV